MEMDSNSPHITLAQWDTDFFGLRIARIAQDTLSHDHALRADTWCRENDIRLCVLLADPDHMPTAHVAALHGFHMMDFRVTLDRDLSAPIVPPRRTVRAFQPSDLPTLERIARASYTDSRFMIDPWFPAKARSDEMYALWVRRRCGDVTAPSSFAPADHVVVADSDDGQPAGFVTCVLRPSPDDGAPLGMVDLVAVDAQARGQGIGEAMVLAALAWFRSQGCQHAEVVTQGRNVRAQRTYQRCGFLTRRAQTWYHRWYGLAD
jgi:dTDP-4-amino-4,6-dideoxy-D-galactose acyltransferase